MAEYRVTWTMDITANSPENAAYEALRVQRDPDSIATVFEVEGDEGTTQIDLG